jgi:hypothetical protein
MASTIKAWELTLIWDDGTENDVANYVPVHLSQAIDEFANYWEEKYNDDDYEKEESNDD